MPDVIIVGIGQTPVNEHWDISLRELSFTAIEAARQDCGGLNPQALFVSNMLAPALSAQAHLGALVADFAGLTGIEASVIEASGASGGAALRMGYLAVASGAIEVALVVGVEKMTDQIGSTVEAATANAADNDYEAAHGLTPTAQAALLMQRYLHEYHVQHQDFAGFAITAHANGSGNPNAMYQKPINLNTYQHGGIVSEPLNTFDIAPNADGAAAIILTRADLLPPHFPNKLVRISGSSSVTDTLALHDRTNPLDFKAARLSVERACRQAAILPEDVDFFELHDAYSIFTVLSLEAAGFAESGKGWQMAQDDKIGILGRIPISTMGGLKARGNPGGATGVYQIVEAVMQLREQAGKCQVPSARKSLVQCLGGPAATAVTHVLEVMK
jgi:acetyl-CoA C-acetyltransferase